eukprot:TRINITY_DN1933_c0_g1_i4.p1 TRINITY_DN1933_c0_g1~~TRINITY_DN1933_c0_g1_i4.p1  ORF type:complete len:533 (+),score=48.13 TRINITY_DN1933_c0_g1_i4:156-1754(+)
MEGPRISARLQSKRHVLSTLNNNVDEVASEVFETRPTKRCRNTGRIPKATYSGAGKGLDAQAAAAALKSHPVDRGRQREGNDKPQGQAVDVEAAANAPNDQGQVSQKDSDHQGETASKEPPVCQADQEGDKAARRGSLEDLCAAAETVGSQGPASDKHDDEEQVEQPDDENAHGAADQAPDAAETVPGVGLCTYTNCTYMRGEKGDSPGSEAKMDGASKVCRVCSVWLHKLCCQEITGREGDFICETCYKPAGPEQSGAAKKSAGGRSRKGRPPRSTAEPSTCGASGKGARPAGGGRSAAQAGASPVGAAGPGHLGRQGKNGGRLGVVPCPKCKLVQESGRKYCRGEGCNAPIREARAAKKLAAEDEAMRAAAEAADFSMTSASRSVNEFTRKRVLIASGGRAEAVLLLAHRNQDGEKTFRFYGVGKTATLFAKNPTVQASFKTHMERLYEKDDERREREAKAKEPLTTNDVEVQNFLKGLGSEYEPYIESFWAERFTMESLKLAKDVKSVRSQHAHGAQNKAVGSYCILPP